MEKKDIRLKDIIGLLGGRTRIAIYKSVVDNETSRITDYMKPIFKGCIDEDFRYKSKPTWTSNNKKTKEIRDEYSNYFIINMNVYDKLQDQTLNIWVSENQQ